MGIGAALALALTPTGPLFAQDTAPPPAPADPAPAPADPAPAEPAPALPEPAPAEPGAPQGVPHPSGTGTSYGGRATGPAALITLPEDPAYPVPAPPENENLPEEVDALAPRQDNLICDPVDKPGMIAFAELLSDHYGRAAYSTSRSCINLKSDHYDGRALDWSLNAHDPMDRRIGDAVVTWLTDNDGEMAHRFGIQSIIWNHRVWNPWNNQWYGYVGQSAHTDHIHFSFTWDGAMMRTSWWTGIPVAEPDHGPCSVVAGQYAAIPQGPRLEVCPTGMVAPPETGYTRLRMGESGPGLGLVQPLLEVEQTGVFDPETREALIAWQGEHGIPQTGVLDQLTYAVALGWEVAELPEQALAVELEDWAVSDFTPFKRTEVREGDRGEAVAALQRAIGAEDDGVFGPLTAEALAEVLTEDPLLDALAEEPVATTLVWHRLEVAEHPTMPIRHQSAEIGDRGELVELAQELLGVEADGIFGPITEAAVQEVQETYELEVTGVVDGATWAVLEQYQADQEQARIEAEEQERLEAEREAQEQAEREATAAFVNENADR